MALLDNTTTGKVKKPLLALIYGPDGVGKTTFGADAPAPFFIGKEDGSNNLNVTRFTPNHFLQIMEKLTELEREEHPFKTVVIDSLDWIEPMVFSAVCEEYKKTSIEDVLGGYGKGYLEAMRYWTTLMDKLQKVRTLRGLGVIALAHSQVKVFNDPSQPAPYDRYQLKLNEKASALWREFVDLVGFANFEVYTKAIDKEGKKSKAFGEGGRVLFTERRPSFDAKNRFGLPFRLALSYSDFIQAVNRGEPDSADSLLKQIDELSKLVDEKTQQNVKTAVDKAAGDTIQLNKFLNRLRVLTTKE